MIFFFGVDPLLHEVARSHDLDKHVAAVRRVLSPRSKHIPEKVFRWHRATWDDVIEQPDIGYRVHLDELLSALSALNAGGLNSGLNKSLPLKALAPLREILTHSAVQPYYERYYPYAPPILVLDVWDDRLDEAYKRQWRLEQRKKDWETHYRGFLHLDAKFAARSKMTDFLDLLDEYSVDGIWLEDLREGLRTPETLRRFLGVSGNFKIIEGLDAFLAFSNELDRYLAALDDLPVLRGHVWLHFAYWYGNGGDQMRDVADWLWKSVSRSAPGDGSAPSRTIELGLQTREMIKRVADPFLYPRELFELAPKSLGLWADRAGLLKTHPGLKMLFDQRSASPG
jgi:hypothetical protein